MGRILDRGRGALGVLGVAWALGAFGAPAGAQDPPPPQQGLKSVAINLLTGTIASDLPFDEPFLLTGSGPTDALEVQVRYLSHPREIRVAEKSDSDLCANATPSVDVGSRECLARRRACERNPGAKPDGVPCFVCSEKRRRSERNVQSGAPRWSQDEPERVVANPIDCPQWEPAGQPLTWRYADLEWDAASNPPDKNRPFVVTVPALEAERYYSFHLSLRTSSQDAAVAAQAASLRTAASELFLQELRAVPDDAELEEKEKCLNGAADAPSLCKDLPGQLCNLLLGLDQASGVEFEQGSLCAPDGTIRPPADLQGQISDLVLARQSEIDALADRADAQPTFEDALGELRQQLAPAGEGRPSALAKLFAALESLAASPEGNPDGARAKRILDGLAPGRALIETSASGRASLALGYPADAQRTTEDPAIHTDPAVATALAQGYGQTAKTFGTLEDGLTDLISPAGLQRLLIDRWMASDANQELPAEARLRPADLTGPGATVEGAIRLIRTARQLAFGLGQAAGRIAAALTQERADALEIADRIVLSRVAASFVVDGRAFAAFQTQQANYISADLGVAFAPELSEVVPALGVNLYLRPINKNVPLRLKGGFKRRFAFTFGVSYEGIADGSGDPPVGQTREDLVSGHSLLLGAGYRLTDSMRLTAGAVVFYELDPNPLKNDRSVSYTPFVALSFDWDVAKLFRGALQNLGLPPT